MDEVRKAAQRLADFKMSIYDAVKYDDDAEAIGEAIEGILVAALAAPRADTPRWWTCATHGDAMPHNAWGCPECVRELRAQVRDLAAAPAAPAAPPTIRSLGDDESYVSARVIVRGLSEGDLSFDEAVEWIEKLVRHNMAGAAAVPAPVEPPQGWKLAPWEPTADMIAAPVLASTDVLLLKQAGGALELAGRICDRVPTRWHTAGDTQAARDIGRMVNAQDDGSHGYRLINEAFDAVRAKLAGAPVGVEPPSDVQGDSLRDRAVGPSDPSPSVSALRASIAIAARQALEAYERRHESSSASSDFDLAMQGLGYAARPAADDEPPTIDPEAATRLRLICKRLGLASSVPQDDATLMGSLFAVFGMIRAALDLDPPCECSECGRIFIGSADRDVCKVCASAPIPNARDDQ